MAFKRDNLDYESMLRRVDRNCRDFGIRTRPKASHGFWLSTLLPAAFLVNTSSHLQPHFDYRLSTIVCFGLLLQSIEIFLKLGYGRISKKLNFSTKLVPGLITSFLVWICLDQHIAFCLTAGYLTTFLYNAFFFFLLKKFPKSFTLGEASLVVQGYVIFLYNSYIQVPYYYNQPPVTEFTKLTAIIQIGCLGVNFIILLIYFFSFLRKAPSFYCVLITITLTVMVFPVTREPPVFILFTFLFETTERLLFIAYQLGLMAVTGCICWWQIYHNKSVTSTRIRKLFHGLIVMVYVPGIIYQCSFLFVAAGITFAIFIMLETARIVKLDPVHETLQTCVQSFIDEKDAGKLALTPIYLLVGCSLPLWLHVCSCDLHDETIPNNFLPLIAGVLSVGVGDTVASIIGSMYGRHKWNPQDKQSKTIEGTAANMLSQFIFVLIFCQLNFIEFCSKNLFIALLSIVASALIEAKTDQIDNLVLPLISFIFLSL